MCRCAWLGVADVTALTVNWETGLGEIGVSTPALAVWNPRPKETSGYGNDTHETKAGKDPT